MNTIKEPTAPATETTSEKNAPVKARKKAAPAKKKAAVNKKAAAPKKVAASKKAPQASKKTATAKPVVKAIKKVGAPKAEPEKTSPGKEKSKKDNLKAQIAVRLQSSFIEFKEMLGEKKFENLMKKATKVLATGIAKKPKVSKKEKAD